MPVLSNVRRGSSQVARLYRGLTLLWNSFSPANIPGLELWLDAADESTITADGAGLVSQWDDKSGFAHHATVPGEQYRPQTGVETLNGRNVITQAANKGLDVNSYPLTSDIKTWFIVWDIAPEAEYIVLISTSATNTYYLAAHPTQTNSPYNGVGDVAARIGGEPFSGNRQDAWDAVTPAPTVYTVSGLFTTPRSFRTYYSFGSTVQNIGNLAEVLCYDGELSLEDIQTVEQYLANKWGIAL